VVFEIISEAKCQTREIKSGHILHNCKEIMVLEIAKIIGGIQRVPQLN
jgi:hypothetical protein